MLAAFDISYFIGDSIPIRVELIDEVARDYGDITGISDAWFTVKNLPTDPDEAARLFYRLHAGISIVSLKPAKLDIAPQTVDTAQLEPASYYYDLRLRLAGGVVTVAAGQFTALQHVTALTA